MEIHAMADALIRPDFKDRGLLAENLLTPAERAERAEKAQAVLREWNGYDPGEQEQAELDANWTAAWPRRVPRDS
ncbi:hypothetical protein [Streptomyces sp. NPDC056948]|uniref:hypothetical protein n=1 Tax=Streptomyces sp. NPDC056948 TaxID=3345975 RepID=UPI00363CDB24